MEVGKRAPLSLLLLIAAASAATSEDAPQCYTGDATSGELTFSGAVEDTAFTGRFGDFSVRYCLAGAATDTHDIRVEVRLSSADSDNRDRDEALKGPEFFAVERHPVSVWQSGSVRREGGRYVAEGELSLKGITAPQSIRYELSTDGQALVASGRFTMDGGTRIDRQRFDVGTGEFADPEFVRNGIEVEFEVTLTAQPEPPAR